MSLWQAARADKNRLEAEAHYARARDAVDKYFARVSDHPRLQTSDFTDLQRELLETALPFYEEMSRYPGDDPKLRIDRALALWRLAKVYQGIGQLEKAAETYDEAIRQQESLANQIPDVPKLQRDLAFLHDELGFVQRLSRKDEACLASHQRAVDVLQTLYNRKPDDKQSAHALGIVLTNQALSLDRMNQDEASHRVFRQAAGFLMPLAQGHPRELRYWESVGTCFGSLGVHLTKTRRYQDAESVLKQAVQCLEHTLTLRPEERNRRYHLGNTLRNLATTLVHLGRWEEAETHLERAREIQQTLVMAFPSIPAYRAALVDTKDALKKALAKRGKAREAEVLQKELLADMSRLVAEYPQQKKYAEGLGRMLASEGARAFQRKEWNAARDFYLRAAACPEGHDAHLRLGQIALVTGDLPAAMRHAEDYVRAAPAHWLHAEQAALHLRSVLKRIQADAAIPKATGEACASHLVQCLQKAVSLGYTGLAFFDRDDRSMPLRERPDYQMLLRQKPVSASLHGSPSRFKFDYRHDNPGLRSWRREELVWTETEPGGGEATFSIMGAGEVDGTPGTLLEKHGSKRLTVFVPDIGTPPPLLLRMRFSDGEWGAFGVLTDVQ